MSKHARTPQQKKQLSYIRDHYVRGSGESIRAWRTTKRVKKRDAVRGARRKAKDAIAKLDLEESPEAAAARRFTTLRQKKIYQRGVRAVGEHAARAAKRRQKT